MKTTMRNWFVVVVSIAVGAWAAMNAQATLLSDTFDTANSTDINSDLAGRQSGLFATQSWTIDRPNTGADNLTQVRGPIGAEGLANTLWLRAESAGATFAETVVGMDISWIPDNTYIVSFDMKKALDGDPSNHVGFGLRSDPNTALISQWADVSGFLFSVRYNGDYLYHEVGQGAPTTVSGPLSTDANGFYNVRFGINRSANLLTDLTIGGTNLGNFNLPLLTGRADNLFFIVPNNGLAAQHAGIDNLMISGIPEPSTAALLSLGAVVLSWRRRR